MKNAVTEGKFIIYSLIAVLVLVLIHTFHTQLASVYNPINYLGIHTILEFFSIAVSMSIFLYGWREFSATKSGKLLLVSLLFLIVGLIDLLHTITFKGMPYFITESSVAKATWFWVIARTIQAVPMLAILLLPNRKLKSDPRPTLLLGALVIVSAIGIFVFSYEKSLPILVVEGEGTTFLKNTIEYFISFLQISAMTITLLIYNERKNQDYLYLALAFTFLFLSELIFTIYQSVYDIDNFSGHLYKVIGYYFLLKGFYLSFEGHSLFQQQTNNNRLSLDEALKEYQGIIFTVQKIDQQFIHQMCEGKLLDEIGLQSQEVVGKSIQEISQSIAPLVIKNYELAWDTQTPISFRINMKSKCLYVSLQPLYKEEQLVELLGNIIDLTSIEDEELPVKKYAQSWG